MLTLSRELKSKIKDTSETLGLKERDVLEMAVTFYLGRIKKNIELKGELDAWDRLSDEALLSFDQKVK